MSQLNLYVPDEVEEQIRKAAKAEGKTISAFLADIIKSHFPPKQSQKDYFSKFFGKWEGSFPEIARPASQERDKL